MGIRRGRANRSKKIIIPESKGVSTDGMHPLFCLRHIQKDYCLSKCNDTEKAAFADALHKRSALTWRELKLDKKHGLGSEQISKGSIRGRIPGYLTDDVTHFLAFRFCGLAPMVGYREGQVFRVFWIDRGFDLYDHGS